jgi:hypothetical protein
MYIAETVRELVEPGSTERMWNEFPDTIGGIEARRNVIGDGESNRGDRHGG